MKIVDLTVKQSIKAMQEAYEQKKDLLITCIADEIIIGHGTNEDLYDRQYCIDNNYAMYNTGCDNGACVALAGDLHFLEYKEGFSDLGIRILECAKDYLELKNLDAEIVGNDLIIHDDNDYKVGSFASVWINGDEAVSTVVHISMYVDMELIERISKKPMEKIPKGLNDYNITSEDILEYIKENIKDFKDLEL